MRTKLKTLLIVVLVTLMCLTVVGCDGDNNGGNDSNGTTPIPQPEPEPEPPPQPKRVCIDPGHGGSDPGTLGWDDMTSNGGGCEWKYDGNPDFPNEADINLDIALKLNTILRNQGFEVVMTRTTDVYVAVSKRVEIAKNENSDIFISIHCNAQECKLDGSKPEDDAYGTETWYATNDTNGSRLSGYVQEELVKSLGLRDRGKKETQAIYVLINAKKPDGTKMPATLAEVSFLTNMDDFIYIRSHTQDAAQGIANGILRYFGKQTMALGQMPTPTTTYSFNVSVSPLGSGSIVPSSDDFSSGTQVNINATPAPGWRFDHWGGDATGNSSAITITMNSDKNVVAYFEKVATTYDLTINVNGQGTTDPSPGIYTYNDGEQVNITALPNTNWRFDHWGGDASGNSPTITITMNSDKNVIAYFEKVAVTYNLTISVNGQGTTIPSPGIYTYDEGTQVTVTASPASNWRFNHWSGDASGSSPMVVVTMDSDKNVVAYFEEVATIGSNVQITRIFYDGVVPRVESDEYVEITNLGDQPQDLAGWVLKDISEGYPSFTFPYYVLEPGVTIRVYTNEIHPEWGGFSFGYGKAIWNNSDADVAALYDAQGREVSRKSY